MLTLRPLVMCCQQLSTLFRLTENLPPKQPKQTMQLQTSQYTQVAPAVLKNPLSLLIS